MGPRSALDSSPLRPHGLGTADVYTPEELRDLLKEIMPTVMQYLPTISPDKALVADHIMIVGAAGGDVAKRRKAIDDVEKLPVAFSLSVPPVCLSQIPFRHSATPSIYG